MMLELTGDYACTLHVESTADYMAVAKTHDVDPVKYRGFSYQEDGRWHVWVKQGSWDLEGLVAHELGHVGGWEHPVDFLPWLLWSLRKGMSTMCCPPRLRDPEGLRPIAAAALLRLGL